MKKVIMLAAVVAALVSCQSKGTKAEEAAADSLAVVMEPTMEETQVYEGVLPAADGPGIRYVLTLNTLANAADTRIHWTSLIWMPKAKVKTKPSLLKENR